VNVCENEMLQSNPVVYFEWIKTRQKSLGEAALLPASH
jgi:hypothetical protein